MKTPTASGAREGTAATWKLGVGDDTRQTYGGSMLAQHQELQGRRRKPLECSRMRHGQLWHGDEEARRPYGASAPEMVRAAAQSGGMVPGMGVGRDRVAAQQQQQRTR
ncbi:unnamed protein product [Miscanthus lutarioriparius]|uniref:Uncharacterized protein n=1 Tax=Miscanthus lutarioriparius TaxID=422564 RepID=A0A811S069_9POAL|nr:unnamed protein product [Miscanthus lutarioriparius]